VTADVVDQKFAEAMETHNLVAVIDPRCLGDSLQDVCKLNDVFVFSQVKL